MPPNGIPASSSLRWKKIASSTGSCCGEVTIRNVVAGSSSSAPTRSARSVKPSISPPSERKNTDRSSSRSTPVTRLSTENTTPVPRPMILPPMPAGRRKRRIARPWKKCVSRPGASRKSSALRDGGVSSTSRSKSPSWSSSNSFAIAVNSCEPATALESCW